MDIKDRVVIQRGRRGNDVGIEIEIVLSGVLPPRSKRLVVVVSAVSVVVKPQTEASSSQSKWPDLGVLSMAADRSRKPLLAKVISYLRMRPRERIVAVSNHLEWFVPAIIAVDHRPNAE